MSDVTSTPLHDRNPTPAPETPFARRLAFAVVGALVADGQMQFDFEDVGWSDRFEVAVLTVEDVLEARLC